MVIDCSIAMTWCFPDEATTKSQAVLRLLDEQIAFVPQLWFLEVVNTLAMAERRNRIDPTDSELFLAELNLLKIEVDHEAHARAFKQILSLCREHDLTSYDAAYLELAHRRSLPLATLDKKLRGAAEKLSIQVLGK